jgi:hypothetical protein
MCQLGPTLKTQGMRARTWTRWSADSAAMALYQGLHAASELAHLRLCASCSCLPACLSSSTAIFLMMGVLQPPPPVDGRPSSMSVSAEGGVFPVSQDLRRAPCCIAVMLLLC